jgi:hypothetical protein
VKVWEVWETQEARWDEDGSECEVVFRSASRRDARDRLYLLRSAEDEIRTRVDGVEQRCARLLTAAASSPRLQRVMTQGGRYTAGSHHRYSIIMARNAVYRRIFGKPEPPLRKTYELRGPFAVTDPEPTYTKGQVRAAVEAACFCGGEPAENCCSACEVWHLLEAGP